MGSIAALSPRMAAVVAAAVALVAAGLLFAGIQAVLMKPSAPQSLRKALDLSDERRKKDTNAPDLNLAVARDPRFQGNPFFRQILEKTNR